jgi:hypothetical protein
MLSTVLLPVLRIQLIPQMIYTMQDSTFPQCNLFTVGCKEDRW